MQYFEQIEALLYVHGDEGLLLADLAELLNLSQAATRQQMDLFIAAYDKRQPSALQVKQYGDLYKLMTQATYQEIIEKAVYRKNINRLSPAALETLSIIAYKQPITRLEVDEIRGVASDGPINTLLTKGLIVSKKRSDKIGRPRLFTTTTEFLNCFDLTSLDDLPQLTYEDNLSQQLDLFLNDDKS